MILIYVIEVYYSVFTIGDEVYSGKSLFKMTHKIKLLNYGLQRKIFVVQVIVVTLLQK